MPCVYVAPLMVPWLPFPLPSYAVVPAPSCIGSHNFNASLDTPVGTIFSGLLYRSATCAAVRAVEKIWKLAILPLNKVPVPDNCLDNLKEPVQRSKYASQLISRFCFERLYKYQNSFRLHSVAMPLDTKHRQQSPLL